MIYNCCNQHNFSPDDEWLCLLYQSKILKHGVAAKKSIEQRFQAVDDKCGDGFESGCCSGL